MTDRHQARVLAMQALCQLETLGEDWLAQLDDFMRDDGPPPAVQQYARQLVRDTWANQPRIDETLQTVAENWELKRMAMVDRNILRIATCELLLRPDVPPKVAINEAVEVGKSFGAAESPAFINGVLDAIIKSKGDQGGSPNGTPKNGAQPSAAPSDLSTATEPETLTTNH